MQGNNITSNAFQSHADNTWVWQYDIRITITDHEGEEITVHILPDAVQSFLQMSASNFSVLSKYEQDHLLESLLAQEFIFGCSKVGSKVQVDSVANVHARSS